MNWVDDFERTRMALHMSKKQVESRIPDVLNRVATAVQREKGVHSQWRIIQRRGFLCFELQSQETTAKQRLRNSLRTGLAGSLIDAPQVFDHSGAAMVQNHIRGLIHVPGLRGNPERSYRSATAKYLFPGTFEPYVAGLINHWTSADKRQLLRLTRDLRSLGLAWDIGVREVDDTRVEVYVSRLARRQHGPLADSDRVSIADVGFGVSQTLPVVVALLAAKPGQLVHVEQPEIHLHPRAQHALADILVRALKRGVRIVLETHSSVLLLAIQTQVAEMKLPRELVKLHWFTRTTGGVTKVISADLDEGGSFGDWPEDFGEISLKTKHRFLTASSFSKHGPPIPLTIHDD